MLFDLQNNPKTELLWEAIFKLNANRKETTQAKLFKTNHKHFTLPNLKPLGLKMLTTKWNYLGFPLCNYFDLVNQPMEDGYLASQMNQFIGKNMLIYGNLVTTRYNKTSQGKLMRLSTFVDQKGAYFDAVHFTDVVNQFPINGLGVYACYGKITDRFGFYSMSVIWSKKLTIIPDPRTH